MTDTERDQAPETAAEVRADTRERMAEYRRVILMLQEERDAYKLLAEGYSGLTVAYRVGGRPPEKALRQIDQARAALRALGIER